MTTLVTKDNDLLIENNNLVLTENDSDVEIEQRLRENLQTYLGEWFLDITIGVPYLQVVFVKSIAPIIIESAFKDVITATPGVAALTQFDPIDFNPQTREITVNFAVQTINNTNLPIGFRP